MSEAIPYFVADRATSNFGKTSSQLSGVDLHFRLRLQFHWNIVGCGTPQQLRPMCPHVRRTLPTTHYLFDSGLARWNWDSLLDFT